MQEMKENFLDQWIHQDEKADVAFLSAPFTCPPVPSIALSIFQSALDQAGISSRVIYCAFPMIHLLGTEAIYRCYEFFDFQKNAEYLFAGLTDVSACAPVRQFVEAVSFRRLSEEQMEEVTGVILSAKSAGERVVEATARRIIHMGARIVAASSIFAQQTGSLAILKRVKELDPSIITMLGGFNVSGEMGKTILCHFPSVDYVSFGDGDEIMAQVCRQLLQGEKAPMPYGIVGRNEPFPDHIPYRMTKDMNSVPTPDYRDFFEEMEREKAGFYGDVPEYRDQTYGDTVFLEGSRGCWWGAKHPCSFCGLNGLTNVYREKAPEKLFSEIREMTARYPGVKIQLSDNVLGQNMFRELLPMLKNAPESYTILAEIKTNLKSEEVRALAEAGIRFTQPGIESLNDHLLELMGKGSTGAQNVALMKYCRNFGVFPVWNMMFQVPGERREDYEQMLGLMPLIPHLTPPTRANTIEFMRFSRYGDHPESYGLELIPDPLYDCCFVNRDDITENIGIYYRLIGGTFVESIQKNQDLYWRIHEAVQTWRSQYYSETRPELIMNDSPFGILLSDTRPCAVENRWILVGLNARVYRLAWEPVSFDTLVKKLPGVEEAMIREALENLISKKLMVFISGKYLALAVMASA